MERVIEKGLEGVGKRDRKSRDSFE